ncbi:fungal trichothecene efflux pump [Aaosphaeria arxii CBS 175.79]|uniref:Fungal trichothecene efflux pump n=1 Tax=Aaosphaeria arxii CBS 175.79 TaxID=1450172 RepID=A0A6A5Y2C2_9PLEO|nr:fungal trichothecene efflux pump [Aaosphaeria arxii CBS 175.79]KAF2019705.1 fungal trichothecene efflux pump [Aaosphaeria arxii CBS 175.79]
MAETVEKNETESAQHLEDVNVVKKVHADGHVDLVDAHAIGGALDNMPKGYYWSPQFIGTVTVRFPLLINADIGPSKNLNWVATIWTIGSAIGFLLVGRLSDIFGRKWMVLGTSVLGLLGCIVGGTAQNIDTLIGANLMNGIAAAGQLSFGIVLGELVPNKHRGPVVTLVFLSSLPFAVFGPIIARLFIQNTAAGWRWSYYLGIILSGVTIILYQFLYHPPTYDQLHVQGKTKWQQFKELDFVGIFLFIAGTVVFLIGLSWGGGTYPWKSAAVISALILGALTLVAFGLYEQYVFKGQAIMPPRLFKKLEYVAIVMVASIAAMVYYALTVLWPTILGTIYTTDSLKIGWASSVVGGGILLGQTFGGLAISYLPKAKWQTIILSVMCTAFLGAEAGLQPDGYATFITLGVLATFVIGWVDNIVFPGVTMIYESQDIGLATGVLGSIRAIGGAVAQTIYVGILTNKLNTYLPEYVIPAATSTGLPASSLPALFEGITLGNFTAVPGITPAIIAATVLLIFFACLSPNFEKYLSMNVAKRLQMKGNMQGVGKENEGDAV